MSKIEVLTMSPVQIDIINQQNPTGPTVRAKVPEFTHPVEVIFDYYSASNEGDVKPMLQIGICGAGDDEAPVWVRFNRDGTIHSVEQDSDISTRFSCSGARDPWRDERDDL